jgi:hypothetical protein
MSKPNAFLKISPAPKPLPPEADAFVGAKTVDIPETSKAPPVSEPMKRFTIDVSQNLHRRIKAKCAAKGTIMADVIRAMLEREFPAD